MPHSFRPGRTFINTPTAQVFTSDGLVLLERPGGDRRFTYTRKEAHEMAEILRPWAPDLAAALVEAAGFAIQTLGARDV